MTNPNPSPIGLGFGFILFDGGDGVLDIAVVLKKIVTVVTH